MATPTRPSPATIPFGPVEIAFDGAVLEPRAWTIEQSAWATELHTAVPDGAVAEMCCGAGQIGLVVAVETGRRLVQVDDHEDACAYARRNAAAAGVDADVRHRALDEAFEDGERFPIILADPPYVPSDETARHDDDPEHAIDGGPDGLDVARQCVEVAARHLAPGGAVLLQLGGAHQAEALCMHATSVGLTCVETREFGPDRAVLLLR